MDYWSGEENRCPFDMKNASSPCSVAASEEDFDNYGGAEDALAVIEQDEERFFAEQNTVREIGVDADVDPTLLMSPIIEQTPKGTRERMLPEGSPSNYFKSRAPSMGSLSGNRERPKWYSPNDASSMEASFFSPATTTRPALRRRDIISPYPMLSSLLRPQQTPIRPTPMDLERSTPAAPGRRTRMTPQS